MLLGSINILCTLKNNVFVLFVEKIIFKMQGNSSNPKFWEVLVFKHFKVYKTIKNHKLNSPKLKENYLFSDDND